MDYTYFDLPRLPEKRLLAFDDACEVRGYSTHQMLLYALEAIEDYRRTQTWSWRFRRWLLEVLA